MVVLLSLRDWSSGSNCSLKNRVAERRKMCRDRVPEICIRVILSVCLNIKMHACIRQDPIRPGKTTGRRTTLRERTTGDLRLKQHFNRDGKHLSSNRQRDLLNMWVLRDNLPWHFSTSCDNFVPDYLSKDICISNSLSMLQCHPPGQRANLFPDQGNKENGSFQGKVWTGLLAAIS